jgi:hypothetical protein
MPEQQEHHISQEVIPYSSSSPSSHSGASSIATSLDELAKGLANGTLSRGKALRLVGGALLGAALASVPGVAWADDRCPEGQTRCGEVRKPAHQRAPLWQLPQPLHFKPDLLQG